MVLQDLQESFGQCQKWDYDRRNQYCEEGEEGFLVQSYSLFSSELLHKDTTSMVCVDYVSMT